MCLCSAGIVLGCCSNAGGAAPNVVGVSDSLVEILLPCLGNSVVLAYSLTKFSCSPL